MTQGLGNVGWNIKSSNRILFFKRRTSSTGDMTLIQILNIYYMDLKKNILVDHNGPLSHKTFFQQ